MGPIVIYYYVNSIGSEFKMDHLGQDEFVHQGQLGLNTL